MKIEADRGGVARPGRAGLGERLGGLVYGTIVVLSVIVTGAKALPHALGRVGLLAAVTTVVFWLAHVYADGLAFSIRHNEHLSLVELGRIARRQASILVAGIPPEVALVLGAVGLFSEQVAVWIALGLGLAVLGAAGIVFARAERLGRVRGLLAVAVNLALGIVLIGLKVLVLH